MDTSGRERGICFVSESIGENTGPWVLLIEDIRLLTSITIVMKDVDLRV